MYIYELNQKKDHFDVGVWASQEKEDAVLQIDNFFGNLKYNLKFALFNKRTSIPDQDNKLVPIPIKRDLNIIYSKHPEYTETNTIIFTNFKNELVEYRENEVVVPLYHPLLGGTSFDMDANMYFMMEYLSMLWGNHQKEFSMLLY